MTGPAADLTIRPMVPGDISRVIEIASGLEHAPHYPRTTWRALLDPQSHPPRVALVAAAPSGQLQGFAAASLLPPQAELEIIAVAAASQRRGVARHLLQSLVQELIPAGIQELWLEVRASNAPAIALYRSLGFQETGRRPRYYAGPVEDGLLMDLQLGEQIRQQIREQIRD